jgi:hypothetical protein
MVSSRLFMNLSRRNALSGASFALLLTLTGCAGSPVSTANQTPQQIADSLLANYDTDRLCRGLAKIHSGECEATKEAFYPNYCEKMETAVNIALQQRGEPDYCRGKLAAAMGIGVQQQDLPTSGTGLEVAKPTDAYTSNRQPAERNTAPKETVKPAETPAPTVATKVESDRFRGTWEATTDSFGGKLERGLYFAVLAAVEKDGAVAFYMQILLNYKDDDWRRFSYMYQDGGDRIEAIDLPSDVDCTRYGCSYTETLNFYFKRSYLEQKRGTGFEAKIYGVRGEDSVINVPSTHIDSLLAAVENASK